MTSYKTVITNASAELTVKRSRFIGNIAPVTSIRDAIAFMEQIRKKHYGASHNVYACSIRDPAFCKFSDDGEPQGTAGLPALNVLQKENITDCVLVITRYFGGTMLGAGGLVRAYSSCAKLALDAAGIKTMRLCLLCELNCGYSLYGRLTGFIPEQGGKISGIQHTDAVRINFIIPKESFDKFSAELTELTLGAVQALVTGEDFF